MPLDANRRQQEGPNHAEPAALEEARRSWQAFQDRSETLVSWEELAANLTRLAE